MKTVNNKLIKLSLSILSCVFFGCGNDGNTPNLNNAVDPNNQIVNNDQPQNNKSLVEFTQKEKEAIEKVRDKKRAENYLVDDNYEYLDRDSDLDDEEDYYEFENSNEEEEVETKESENYVLSNEKLIRGKRRKLNNDEKFILKCLNDSIFHIKNATQAEAVGRIGKGITHPNVLVAIPKGAELIVNKIKIFLEKVAKSERYKKSLLQVESGKDSKKLAAALEKNIEFLKSKMGSDEGQNLKKELKSLGFGEFNKGCKEKTGVVIDVSALFEKVNVENKIYKDLTVFTTRYYLQDTKTDGGKASIYSVFNGKTNNSLSKRLSTNKQNKHTEYKDFINKLDTAGEESLKESLGAFEPILIKFKVGKSEVIDVLKKEDSDEFKKLSLGQLCACRNDKGKNVLSEFAKLIVVDDDEKKLKTNVPDFYKLDWVKGGGYDWIGDERILVAVDFVSALLLHKKMLNKNNKKFLGTVRKAFEEKSKLLLTEKIKKEKEEARRKKAGSKTKK